MPSQHDHRGVPFPAPNCVFAILLFEWFVRGIQFAMFVKRHGELVECDHYLVMILEQQLLHSRVH